MFDIDKFSSILKNINSKYDTMTEFSKKANFDRTYISKYINKKLNSPPTPKILKKIADSSQGVTTYEELMEVCGYIDEIQKLDKIKSELLIKKQKIMETIKKINLNNDEKDFLCYIIDKKEKILKTHRDMLKNNKMILAKEYFHEAYTDLQNEISKAKSKNIKKAYGLYNELDSINHDLELCLEETPTNSNKKYEYQETIKIPVVGTVAAGEPILAEQNIIDYEELPASEFQDGEYFRFENQTEIRCFLVFWKEML